MDQESEAVKVKLQIDVDGVLADFMRGASELARKIDSTVSLVDTYTTEDWDHWEGWKKETVDAVWAEIKKEENLYFYKLQSLLSKYEWRELRKLNSPQNQLYFVTSRPGKTAKWQTECWLYDRLESSPTVIITGDKAGFARLIRPDFSIEDNAVNAEGIARVIGPEKSLLINRRYNTNLHPQSATRINLFKDFLEKVNA